MDNFDENDVTIEHAKLADGGGCLRVVHRPSGLFVESRYRSTTPVLKVKEHLMDELRIKVLSAGGQGGEVLGAPSLRANGDIPA